MVVNDNWKLFPEHDVLYSADPEWWERHIAAIPPGGRWCTQSEKAATAHGIEYWPSHSRPGLCQDSPGLHQGGNSGYQSINLCYHLGGRSIALLGYDMQHTGGKAHWFGDHPRGLNNAPGVARWAQYFPPLAEDCISVGMEVVNCSRETALQCFERMDITEWIHRQRERLSTGST